MKNILIISFIFSALLSFCNHAKIDNSKNKIKVDTTVLKFNVPKNVDSSFKIFIDYFSKDTIFQISRIKFPLKVKQYDSENDKYTIKYFDKTKFIKVDFRQKKLTGNIDQWKQKIDLAENKATIEILGIDNGIMVFYYFEKQNGKWTLTDIEDAST